MIDVDDEENTRLTNSPLYINVPDWSIAESSPVYEEIHGGEEQPLPNDDDSNASNHSDSLLLEYTESSTAHPLRHRRVRGTSKITSESSDDDQVS